MADEQRAVRLKITGCTVAYSGKNKRQDQYTIYEIRASKENGEPVNEKLRSFEELTVGETLDLNVVPFRSEQYGTSYTLSQRNKPSSHKRIDELEKLVKELAARTERLEAWARSRSGAARPAAQQPAQQAPPAQQVEREVERQADLDARFGVEPH